MPRATSSPAFHELDPAVVCGLIHERGEAARSATYDAAWERDIATWRQVQKALDDAREGVRPARTVDEPPRWLARLVRMRLADIAERRSWDNAFETIRALERLGLVDLEVDDTYVLAVVSTNGDRFAPLRADYLRADPELRENVVWRMFEVEGGGEISLANVDKYSHEKNGWKQAFLDLTADGTLPRPRVLTAALDALNRDFSAYRAGWYARLYDALSPTIEEQAGHQDRFRRLLRSEIAATVKLAVTRLHAVSKAGLLDDAATVPSLPPALLVPVKGTAGAAVRLLTDIADRTPALAGQVAEATATALGHPHADVQKAAAALLTRLGAQDMIAAASDDLEPSVRAVLGLAPHRHDACAPSNPVHDPPRALVPAGTGDLLDRFAALLEDASDPVELELVLAGLASSGDPDLLAPLVKRARKVWTGGPRDTVFRGWLRGQLARLVLVAHAENASPLPRYAHSIDFLVHRLTEVSEVVRRRRRRAPGALLATPDHPLGWLSPGVLVQRLIDRDEPPGHYDTVAALLRLHPEGRADASRLLARLGDQVPIGIRAPLTYALGGPLPGSSKGVAGAPALWVAASRVRNPFSDDDWLDACGVRGAGRSRPIAARLTFRAEHSTWSDDRGLHPMVTWYWSLGVESPADRLGDDEPTATTGYAERPHASFWEDVEDFVGWQALTWPHDAERFLVDAVHPVLETATSHEVRHDAVRVLEALYRHPGRLGPLSWITLAAGLTAARADERARAVDAVLHFAGAGRLTAAQLARGLADLAGPGTPTRWAGSLKDVAAGPAGRRLVIDTLGAALPEFDPARRGLHALLELLREELLREQTPTPAALRPWLSQFSGSSRTATAARNLLGDP